MTQTSITSGRDLTYAFFSLGFGDREKLRFVLRMQGTEPEFYSKCVLAALEFYHKKIKQTFASEPLTEDHPGEIKIIRLTQDYFLELLHKGPERAFYIDHVKEYIREATTWCHEK